MINTKKRDNHLVGVVMIGILLLLISVESTAQFKKKNFIKLSDKIYISKNQVTVGEYTQFLAYVKQKDITRYMEFLPAKFYMGAYTDSVDMKLNYPGFRYQTISNITYEAAKEFCLWLTQKYEGLEYRLPERLELIALNNFEMESIAEYGDLTAEGEAEGFITEIQYEKMDVPSTQINMFDTVSDKHKTGQYDFVIPDEVFNKAFNIDTMLIDISPGKSIKSKIVERNLRGTHLPSPKVSFRYVIEIVE